MICLKMTFLDKKQADFGQPRSNPGANAQRTHREHTESAQRAHSKRTQCVRLLCLFFGITLRLPCLFSGPDTGRLSFMYGK